ncbi:HD-GYP domain-containing protein (c-di-GMP phosphodiesterase class II) [Paenibacillus taihuensis]|uniref:HD-GYP domain-containing protein (C-di-GMP phosphodiesterase class II) n=1 Tax=Paenibacillus taihuensis TaxID=1156355 RepID=A0A3D9R1Y6_9BACL|nr:HD-GYP domain-containing protein [Paenibacillus taihuensis]REE68698.1 HD-GYP domain-containing protein (c-di-GMP phosphodiesterase class II) [Paenibacillus taihuensis]
MRQFIGKTLKHDVVNQFGVTVLPARIVLLEEHLALLEKHKIDNVSIFFDVMPPPEQKATSAQAARAAVGQVMKRAKAMYETIRQSGQVPMKELQNDIIPAVKSVAGHPNMFELFEAVKAQGDYTYQHNIGVGILSTMIGKWLHLSDEELTALTMGATLADIGKVKIPAEIINKPGKLTAEEFELVKKHAVLGYEILKNTEGINYRSALIALQHHEREDGGGYPLGLRSEKIDLFSKIVAVADIFHAMSSDRPYQKALPFYEVIRQLRESYFGKLDPRIVSVFLDNMTTKLIGQKVVLTDDREGEIVYINPHDEEAPLVKVGESFVDLSCERQLQIKQIIGL